jgi:hypothetical protein
VIPIVALDAVECRKISPVRNLISAVQPVAIPTELSRLPVVPVEIGIFLFTATSTMNVTKK